MGEMTLTEALVPWSLTILILGFVGAIAGGVEGAAIGATLGPYIGMFASFFYINYSYWGHPLRSGPKEMV